MNQLKLYRYSQEYIKLCEDSGYGYFVNEKKNKIYTCFGEFAHAPGHVLMVEFGTWNFLPGMPEIHNFDKLDGHPNDYTLTVCLDEEDQD
jgi:hypothetical protein